MSLLKTDAMFQIHVQLATTASYSLDLIVQDTIKEWALHHAIPTESVTTIPIAQTTHITEVLLR